MALVDCHCHLTSEKFDHDFEARGKFANSQLSFWRLEKCFLKKSHPSIIFDWIKDFGHLDLWREILDFGWKAFFCYGITSSQSRRSWPEHLVRMLQAGWCGVGFFGNALGQCFGEDWHDFNQNFGGFLFDFAMAKIETPLAVFLHFIFTKVSWFVLHRLQISIEWFRCEGNIQSCTFVWACIH